MRQIGFLYIGSIKCNSWRLNDRRERIRQKLKFLWHVCEVGTVGKISDYQPVGLCSIYQVTMSPELRHKELNNILSQGNNERWLLTWYIEHHPTRRPARRTRVQFPAWSRVELWVTFFRNTVRGQGRQAVGLVSQCSIGGLKRTHTLVDESRLMSVLWSVDERF